MGPLHFCVFGYSYTQVESALGIGHHASKYFHTHCEQFNNLFVSTIKYPVKKQFKGERVYFSL